MKKKVFIATSSFLELENFKKKNKINEFKFVLNPLKKKINFKRIVIICKRL